MRTLFVGGLLLFTQAMWAASGLTYSTYLRASFTPSAIATDAEGNVILAGSTKVSRTSAQTVAMIVKLDPTGKQYLYMRTFGGSGSDAATGIAVDSAGDVYVTGTASSPDFPITPGRQTGTLPRADETRAFLVEFDPQGELLFSDVVGTLSNTGLAVAIAADGGVLVSGISNSDGLASSGGAYSVSSTKWRPFLMKLDAAGSKIVFTATGIGGNALVVDSAGDIYMAGSTAFTDYPTTAGTYQPALNPVYTCSVPCRFAFPGTNQYVTKVDAKASKLIYSTGVAGQSQTVNNGLVVDAAGNAYVTGVANGIYPWTSGPSETAFEQPFLTKLDAAGAHAAYSIPIGGAGVALGSIGDVYVGGTYNAVIAGTSPVSSFFPSPPLGVVSLPSQCQVNGVTTVSEAYASHLDANTGKVLGSVLVDGSVVSANGIAFAGNTNVWLAGAATQGDTPNTPGELTETSIVPGPFPGAYLGEISFSASATSPPQIACIMDGANGARVGVVAPKQILSLFGTGLGPATGVAAKNNTTTSLGGVTISFNGEPAPLLYVSSSQINLAVPQDILANLQLPPLATMDVSINGTPAPSRELHLASSNPSLFANLSITEQTCGNVTYGSQLSLFALNADGSINSCSHAAKVGSVVSLFVNGLGIDGPNIPWLPFATPGSVTIGESAEVVNVTAATPFVWRVDVKIPAALAPTTETSTVVMMDASSSNAVVAVGPVSVDSSWVPLGTPLPLSIWIAP